MRMKALLTIGIFLMATSAIAQNPIDFTKVEIKTTRYNDKFYTFEGSGGMIGVPIGPDGTGDRCRRRGRAERKSPAEYRDARCRETHAARRKSDFISERRHRSSRRRQ